MSTRGALGFRLNETDHLTYNHSDSYPSWLGRRVVEFLAIEKVQHGPKIIENLTKRVNGLIQVTREDKPTPLQIAALREYYDGTVGGSSSPTFYQLLRHTQGDLDKMLKARYYENNNQFMLDGLMCEHAYVINLDTGMLEYYSGFFPRSLGRDLPGRYWNEAIDNAEDDDDYGGVVLCAEIPFSKMTQRGILARVREIEAAQRRTQKQFGSD